MTKKAIAGGILAIIAAFLILGGGAISLLYGYAAPSGLLSRMSEIDRAKLISIEAACPTVSQVVQEQNNAGGALVGLGLGLVILGVLGFVCAALLFFKRYIAGGIMSILVASASTALSYGVGSFPVFNLSQSLLHESYLSF